MPAYDMASGDADDGIAVVGMACRYPDADDPAQLWDLVLSKRRAFRRLPAERFAVEEYLDPTRRSPDSVYGVRAALLEGWHFDRAAFRVPGTVHRAADPAHWLALETAARALEDAGSPGGGGFDRDRVAVVLGNTLTGEVTRARTLRLRWPYVRAVLASVFQEEGLDKDTCEQVLARTARRYLEPFPAPDDEFLSGGLANTIAGRVCNHFDFHGGGFTVDGACSSSLLAVITACGKLRDNSADLVLAGGVDISLDPFELVGFARLGALAEDRMRIYDEDATGFLPGEGCGVVALMRARDAAAANLPVYAEIRGWGMSSDGAGGITRPEQSGQLLALRRAYEHAGIEPSALGLVEGHGTGTGVGDAVELRALSALRAGAERAAVLGSVKANIGHTKAAAGVAGLIKACMSVSSGVLPPTTGCEKPREELAGDAAVLRVPTEAEAWPRGERIAGVSAFGFGGINTHLVLSDPRSPRRPRSAAVQASLPRARRGEPAEELVLLSGDDPAELADRLERLARAAPRFSDAEVHDLAVLWGRAPHPGPVRVALVADSPEQLAERAKVAAAVVAESRQGALASRPGVWVGHTSAGRVTLLLPGQGAPVRADLGEVGADLGDEASGDPIAEGTAVTDTAIAQPAIHRASLAGLRWLDKMGVQAEAALGHSLGEYAALVWAGCLDGQDSAALVAQRGRLMADLSEPGTGMLAVTADAVTTRELRRGTPVVIAAYNGPSAYAVAGPLDELAALARRAADRGVSTVALPVAHGFHSPAVAKAAEEFAPLIRATRFARPRRTLLSSVSGGICRVGGTRLQALLCDQMTEPVRFWEALGKVASRTDLFCEAGAGHALASLATQSGVPVVSLDVGARGSRARAQTAAALFACGALQHTGALFEGREGRPVDPWRERVFIPNPCARPELGSEAAPAPSAAVADEEPREAAGGATGEDLTSIVVRLVAQATELEPASLALDQRLLSDLHLSSLKVTQLLTEAACAAGLEPPVAPLAMADASLAEIIDVLGSLPEADGDDRQETVVPGVGPWVRCFVEEPRPVALPEPAPVDRPGRVTVPSTEGALCATALRLLLGDAAGQAELAYVPDAASRECVTVLLGAARAALEGSHRLVLVTHGSGLSGFAGSLHQEHPELGITVLRVPQTDTGLERAAVVAAAEPGVLRELIVCEDGTLAAPTMVSDADPAAGEQVLGPNDVLLVSGGGKGLGFEGAAAFALSTGASLALLGRSDPVTDESLRRNLQRLAELGITASYQRADITDPLSASGAVAVLERKLGPVTALLHASGVNDPRRFTELTEAEVHAHLAPKTSGLSHLLAAVDRRRLRLLIGFGSVIGRYGLAGECHYALANGALRQMLEDEARTLPDCRTLVIDWSVWADVGMGERLGVLDRLARLDVTPIPLEQGLGLLLRLAGNTPLPTAVTVHGRMGLPPRPLAAEPHARAGRFLQHTRVHYPGVELVVDNTVSEETDPYLSDHRIGGLTVLPAVVGLEAMAQVASALAGRPLRHVQEVSLDRPVTLADGATRTLRLCALAEEGGIAVVLRSDETAFRADHFRAWFPLPATARAAEPDGTGPAVRPVAADDPGVPSEDLYGPLYFHTGRFRRVGALHGLRAREVRAGLHPDTSADWFGSGLPQGLLLGSPGRNDATIHALQACVPHRRLLPVGCEEFWAAEHQPQDGDGEAVVHARELWAEGGSYVWDVEARDGEGRLLARWRRLRLTDVGQLPRRTRWTPPLLAVALERGALTLGLDSALTVAVEPGGAQDRSVPPVRPPHGTSRSHCGRLTLTAAAPGGAAVDWQQVSADEGERVRKALGAHFAALWHQLRPAVDEPEYATAARLWTVAECMGKAGRTPTAPVTVDGVFEDGWVRFRSGRSLLATVVLPARLAPEEAVNETETDGDSGTVIAVALMAREGGGVHVAAQNVQPPASGDAGGDQPRRQRVLQ
ncbi:type I polyketide synthase [Streptomyces melanogenes]|uniref:type I polyketide synthase n=1 Tax=Streptomyces melanogenes TaxID=67326 RepID=UPI00167C8D23|nr:type I polyketide synthase [Streptomyces melanogenes]GGP92468.1 polyketide synthase [Streptomyces melanogenes]